MKFKLMTNSVMCKTVLDEVDVNTLEEYFLNHPYLTVNKVELWLSKDRKNPKDDNLLKLYLDLK